MREKRPIYKKVDKFVLEIKDFLEEIYGENLLAAIVFGSYPRGEFSMNSDIDLLIIIKKSSNRMRERLNEFYQKVEEKLGETRWILSPIILTEQETKRFSPIYLDILEHHLVLYDRGIFSVLTKKLTEYLKQGKIEKRTLSDHTYWRIKNEEEISL